jgi:hypothetical protein
MKSYIELYLSEEVEVSYNEGVPMCVKGLTYHFKCPIIKAEYQSKIIEDIKEIIAGLSDEWYYDSESESGELSYDGENIICKVQSYINDIPEEYMQ